MADKNSNSIENINEVLASEGPSGPELSLEDAIKLLNTERLSYLRDETTNKISQLQKMQQSVEVLQTLLQRINAITDKDGKVNFSKDTGEPKIEELIKQAKDLGVKWDKTDTKLSREEKDQLVSNVRLTIDNLNVKNDMALQEITRLTNERYESYQIARSMLKPLDDVKKSMARAARGG